MLKALILFAVPPDNRTSISDGTVFLSRIDYQKSKDLVPFQAGLSQSLSVTDYGEAK